MSFSQKSSKFSSMEMKISKIVTKESVDKNQKKY